MHAGVYGLLPNSVPNGFSGVAFCGVGRTARAGLRSTTFLRMGAAAALAGGRARGRRTVIAGCLAAGCAAPALGVCGVTLAKTKSPDRSGRRWVIVSWSKARCRCLTAMLPPFDPYGLLNPGSGRRDWRRHILCDKGPEDDRRTG